MKDIYESKELRAYARVCDRTFEEVLVLSSHFVVGCKTRQYPPLEREQLGSCHPVVETVASEKAEGPNHHQKPSHGIARARRGRGNIK